MMDCIPENESQLLHKNKNRPTWHEIEEICHEATCSHLICENPTDPVPNQEGIGLNVRGGDTGMSETNETIGFIYSPNNVQFGFLKAKKSPLSDEFKVAAEIYRCELNGKRIWYTELVSLLKGEMAKNTVSKALDVLFDWGIVKSEFGETDKGRPGKLLTISNDSKATIGDLYNKYWKNHSG